MLERVLSSSRHMVLITLILSTAAAFFLYFAATMSIGVVILDHIVVALDSEGGETGSSRLAERY